MNLGKDVLGIIFDYKTEIETYENHYKKFKHCLTEIKKLTTCHYVCDWYSPHIIMILKYHNLIRAPDGVEMSMVMCTRCGNYRDLFLPWHRFSEQFSEIHHFCKCADGLNTIIDFDFLFT